MNSEWFAELDHHFYELHPSMKDYRYLQYEPFTWAFPLVVDGNYYGVKYAFSIDSSDHATIVLLVDGTITRVATTKFTAGFANSCKELHNTALLLFYGY